MTESKSNLSLLAYNETLSCVRCGYCLPACPTYETMGSETDSPRGRIQLVKAAAEGKLNDLDSLAMAIDNCLGCRACETACPSGVRYGQIYESAKRLLYAERTPSFFVRFVRTCLLRTVKHKGALKLMGMLLSFMQAIRLLQAVQKVGLDRFLPAPIRTIWPALPKIPHPLALRKESRPIQPPSPGELTVLFFQGCVMDVLYRNANLDSMRLLKAAGIKVIPFQAARCCGALHAHAGDEKSARELAKHNIEALERLELNYRIDYVVNAAGGCGAMLQEYAQLLSDEPEWRERAKRFAAKCVDISYVLLDSGNQVKWRSSADSAQETVQETVTYQPSCHMTHVQKNRSAPLKLIHSVPGIRYVPMENADMCCGSAGIYNFIRYEQSMDILDRKMEALKKSGATTVIATNPGCMLQLELGLKRAHLHDKVKVVHLAEWLAQHVLDLSNRSNRSTSQFENRRNCDE